MTARRTLWPALAAMAVAGPAAVVASGITLASLARAAGWQGWTPWLLPATVDVAGFACGWYWLRPGAPDRARRFGRAAFVALTAGSVIGNGAGHLVSTGRLHPSSVLIVVVGAVPALVLVVLGHLAALTIGVTVEDDTEEAAELAPSTPAVSPDVSPDPAPAGRPETPARAPRGRSSGPARSGALDREAAALAYAARVRATDPGHRFTGAEMQREFRCRSEEGARLRDLVNSRDGADDDETAGERVQ